MNGTGRLGEHFDKGKFLCGAFECGMLEVSGRMWGAIWRREVAVLAHDFAVGLLSSWGMSKLLVCLSGRRMSAIKA